VGKKRGAKDPVWKELCDALEVALRS
jgi:hypothetical protein